MHLTILRPNHYYYFDNITQGLFDLSMNRCSYETSQLNEVFFIIIDHDNTKIPKFNLIMNRKILHMVVMCLI